ncbi:pyruvate dehydrogenase (quinone) [Endobacter medicaginis]|uniref:Pyruvate dehydrogenase (Quinone) n=1 Tax=Endobacter medicaginis TaxID=1181271 RepID=A0A839V3S2_9PROT|nr:thiamine pyrophosphate-dependent enzyme [Endobacter medicaginis]MBB3174131.1 pyruvate dehydrogenase (quinone) [Endobacter medicaginis]MCX5474175.1 thiamine pyrophosphate-binding protein [Endobacter medicaginis]NVN31085.1 ubiquinone-dependent pyruvate dehydrogenase [Endobacter medicaginis]
MSRNVAQMMVETLAGAGVQRCYGVPGDTLNHFTDALHASAIRFVHVRHEEVGAFAAGAEALLADRLTLCAGSCGPGSLHFINGLWESNRNRAPVLLIASQIMRDQLGFEFPQEVDFRSVYRAGTVFCEEIRTPAQAQRMTVMAAQAAVARRGVAVLIVPADIFSAKAETDLDYRTHFARPVSIPRADELDVMAEMLNSAGRVTIYGGSGCEHAHDQVVRLADVLKAPVARTSRAKDFLEHDNPFDVGMTGMIGTQGGLHAVSSCDTLLLLGCDFAWTQFYPSKARIIQLDLDPTHLGRRHPIDLGVSGDVAATIEALLPRLQARTDRGFLDEALDHAARAQHKLEERAVEGHRGVIHPQYLTATLARHADRDAIFTADGGSPMVWLLRHVPANGHNRTLTSLSHGTMANAMPQALGAQAAFPGRQVISLSGDGGLSMLLGDLLTVIQEKLPVKVVVFNNGSLNFVELEQKVEGLLDNYTDLVNPDFAKVAAAIGLWSRRVEDPADLDAAVVAFLAAPGPALLDVVTDRYELVMPPTVQAAEVAGMALYTVKGVLGGRVREVAGLLGGALRT